MLSVRERFKPRYAAMRAAAKAKQSALTSAASAAAASGGSLAAVVASAGAAAAAAKPSPVVMRRLREVRVAHGGAGVYAVPVPLCDALSRTHRPCSINLLDFA
jgi:hypothetical protein